MTTHATEPLLHLNWSFRDPIRKALFSMMGGTLEKVLSIDGLNRTYAEAAVQKDDRHFSDKILEVLHVAYEVSAADLQRIPRDGPLVVVANHPFGGLEGIILYAALRSVRPDVKLMANYLLDRIPDLRGAFILVDPFGGENAAKMNLRPLREAIQWLRQGGVLGTFPSGEVSHVNLARGGVTDPPWSDSIARIVRKTKATVLPVYFHGSNSLLFQLLGLLHPRLRTAMLPHEVLNKRDRTIQMRIGSPIEFRKLERLTDDGDFMDYLRMRTYYLENRQPSRSRAWRLPFPLRVMRPREERVAAARAAEYLRDDIARLPAEQVLVAGDPLMVCYARAGQIPNVLHEIGRLRELTFRDAGEGTGRAIDLDRFDQDYIHLFLWNRQTREVVGAYRLGPTDEIMSERGRRGLYTSTLFHLRQALLRRIDPALEMGRSFVRKEYQRSFSALNLLWKGIGQFVVRHPRYKILFGPVSVNNEYQSSTRQLLVAFLKANNYAPDLARLVRARKPMRPNRLKAWKARKMRMVMDSIDDVESLIGDVESDLKYAPILLKQYLKLGGKLVGFNIDPAFKNALDGLILVDLTATEPRILGRYLGEEGRASFLRHHGVHTS